MFKNYTVSLLLLCFAFYFGYGQVTIYTENMYNGIGGSSGNSIAVHESNNRFNEDYLTYSGTGDMRTTNSSAGNYPTASGSFNVFFNAVGENFIIDGLNLFAYANIVLSFGVKKNTNAENGSNLIMEYSTSGASGTYYPISYTNLPTGTGTVPDWHYVSSTSVIPIMANAIRFRSNTTQSWNIDDILIEGDASTNTFVEFTSSSSSIPEDGLSIDICASITNPSASNATSVDIVLDPSSTATNGADFDDGASTPGPIPFPFTLTFPAGSSADQCFTIYISNDDLLVEGNETVVLNLTNPNGGDAAVIGSNDQHILTIIDNEVPVFANVVITEIMYDTPGTDDEWIEICNVSGSAQVLNNYTIEYNGNPAFTFPSTGAVIADGDCVTVSLGSDGNGTYNIECPFTPDYGIDASTTDTNNLVNSSATITIVADDGATVIDSVTYNNADGGNGNGSSLHVIDDALDNSDTGTNWQEVGVGGSAGTNNLISPCAAVEPDINVEGDLGSFPNISNNDVTPSFLDNTRFTSQLLGNSQTKSFRIQNIGTLDLNVSNIQIMGGGGDFTLTLPSTLPITIAPNNLIVFEVTFAPSVAGTRDATVRISSNDPDENPFQYAISSIGICSASSNIIAPTSGPDNTIVSITGNDLNGSTTVEFGGSIIPHTVISSTEIQVEIPVNSETGNITVTNNLGCVSTNLFTIIDSAISSCEGNSGSSPSDLFISQVTDSNSGSLSYIEIYNGTDSPVNLNGYSIQFFNNGSNVQNGGFIALNNVTLNSGDTYTVRTNVGASCSGVPGANGSFADQIGTNGGINFGSNSDDHIRLYNGSTHIDSWGEYLSAVWADPLGIGSEGVTFSRNSTATTLPNTTFDVADWSYINWSSCSENDYSDIGTFDFSTGTPPTVNSISNTTTACNEVTITVWATEGFASGNELRYTWYAFNPAQALLGWQLITTGGVYTTVDTSPDLIISDATSTLDYQFYCQVRESDASCYTASSATQIALSTATWNGTTWLWNDGTPDGTPPNLVTNVVLDGNFNTSVGGGQTSFLACNLVLNSGFDLDIANGNYIQVVNNIIADGNITVFPQGSVVQINDFATVTGPGIITVQKETTVLNNATEYTYWSSPVANETIENALNSTPASRRYFFDADNFEDLMAEVGNTGVYNLGQDDIDDNGDAWQIASGAMIPGVGYAAMPSPFGPFPAAQQITFVGHFNNGIIQPTIYNNSGGSYNDWNFIGNPYPSAIDTEVFFTVNSGIADVIYLWNQATPADFNAPGNENANFSNADYAVISGSGINTAGGNLTLIPKNSVPSGQGFFIAALSGTNVTFNNSMRVTDDNDQFYRNSTPETKNANSDNAVWLNLTSDNGVTKQIAIAHLEGATDYYDGSFYDVKENLSSGNAATIYSTIEDGSNSKFVIQCKHVSSLHENEVIPIGFETKITVATLYKISIAQFEGHFLSNNPIYIKDKDHNTIHNLKESDYSFTSEAGEFNKRFEIVFTPNALSIKDNLPSNDDLIIRELSDGYVELTVNETFTITKVDILDLLGRQIYKLKGASSREVYNLSKLSKAAYIAKVTLSNGQIITKKAIKQR